MSPGERRAIIEGLLDGSLPVEEAVARLRHAAVGTVGEVARVDHDRERRGGIPEAILCEGKTPADVGAIARAIVERSGRLLATRATPAHHAAIAAGVDACGITDTTYDERARTVTAGRLPAPVGHVALVTAGTADVPVAEEARVTARFMGARVDALYDVGVAGVHRILGEADRLAPARAVVVCAGMEGALPSVVGGLVGVPVIAVPTSGGYGATFGGLAALLAMVNSCAANVATVGIDDGFGAGHIAALINRAAGDR